MIGKTYLPKSRLTLLTSSNITISICDLSPKAWWGAAQHFTQQRSLWTVARWRALDLGHRAVDTKSAGDRTLHRWAAIMEPPGGEQRRTCHMRYKGLPRSLILRWGRKGDKGWKPLLRIIVAGAVLGACGRVRFFKFSCQIHVPSHPNHCGDRGWPTVPAALILVTGMCEKILSMEVVEYEVPLQVCQVASHRVHLP